MIPQSYRTAFAALEALFRDYPTDSLGALVGSMRLNPNDQIPMDAAALEDWNRIVNENPNATPFQLLLAYLEWYLSLYEEVPEDFNKLMGGLRTSGTRQQRIAQDALGDS